MCYFVISPEILLNLLYIHVLYLMEIYRCHRIAGKCFCICCDNSTFCVLYFNRHFWCFLLPLNVILVKNHRSLLLICVTLSARHILPASLQSFYFSLTSRCTVRSRLSVHSPLSPSVTDSLFHSWLGEPTSFTHPSHLGLPPSPGLPSSGLEIKTHTGFSRPTVFDFRIFKIIPPILFPCGRLSWLTTERFVCTLVQKGAI